MAWHTNSSTLSTSSPGPGVAFSLTSYLGTIQSERAKSSLTREACCTPDSATESCQPSQSGTTSAHSTESLGAGTSMSCAVDSLAKTLAPQGKARVLQESEAVFGVKWHDSFAKYHPESCSWKTPQCSLLGDWEPFSETWPKWGMMRDGVCSERVTPAHLTSAIASGFSQSFPPPYGLSANQGQGDGEFGKAVRSWPTAAASDATRGGVMTEDMTGQSLVQVVNTEVLAGGTSTPQIYPTPRCFMHKDALTDRGKSNLGEVINDKEKMTKTGQLNPSWVEWLMGWPIGWTDLKPLETAKHRSVQLWHGEF